MIPAHSGHTENGPCSCESQETVKELYCFLVVDPDDETEGIPQFFSVLHNAHMPMFGADLERMESMRGIVTGVAKQFGRRVELAKFTNREHVF